MEINNNAPITWGGLVERLGKQDMDINQKEGIMNIMKRDYEAGMSPSDAYFDAPPPIAQYRPNPNSPGNYLYNFPDMRKGGKTVSNIQSNYSLRDIRASNELDRIANDFRNKKVIKR